MALTLTATGPAAGELVTEMRRTETQIRLHRESFAHLGRLGRAGELAAAIAHEVNQPLTAARTYLRLVLEVVKSGAPDMPSVRDMVAKAAAEVDRAGEIIQRLRALIRLDHSKREVCHLKRLMTTSIELCQPALDHSNVIVSVSLAAGVRSVVVDALQVQQVFLNLLRNAIEAIDESGSGRGAIVISAKLTGKKFVEITVSDSGPGFPREFALNGFIPLYSTKPHGLGVGLRLCKSIIEAHGGRLWLDPNAAGGSVHFTLPTANPGRR